METLCSRAMRAKSSYSYLRLSTPYPAECFTRTIPYEVSISSIRRFRVYLLLLFSLMPRVVVCLNISLTIFSRSSSRQMTQSITPGRDFFIPMGTVNASSAPSVKIRSTRCRTIYRGRSRDTSLPLCRHTVRPANESVEKGEFRST